MKVLFIKDEKPNVKKGQVKNVTDGYARNYLFPRQIAVPYTKLIDQQVKLEKENELKSEKKKVKKVEKMYDILKDKKIVINANASEDGTLYAGVGKKEIIKKVQTLYKVTLEESQIILEKPIKNIGDHEVGVQVENDKQFNFIISINKE
ncbi:MAG: 50S ribosomal protein L9 [Patescibacteria group bacterium]